MKIGGGNEQLDVKEISGKLSTSINTPLGTFVISKNQNYTFYKEGSIIRYSRTNIKSKAKSMLGSLSATLHKKEANIVDITYNDDCPKRAEDILNTLITVYNEMWLKDKNTIAVSTSEFIDKRLNVIENELGDVDTDISSFKSKNLIPDVQSVTAMYLAQSSANSTTLLSLNNQLSIAKYIKNCLSNAQLKDQLLPTNSGLDNVNIETLINEYNKALLYKNNLKANSSSNNPLLSNLEDNLKQERQSILLSIDNAITAINLQISNLKASENQTNQKIASNPNQAEYLLSVERQQKVKESLYLYLLQKREENELSQAFTAYNTRIINSPTGSNIPISPKKSIIYLLSIVIGVAIPIGITILKENMNTTIRNKKDVESLTIPFLGEIPLHISSQKSSKQLLKLKRLAYKTYKKVYTETPHIVVQEKSRDYMNEAFRVIRTNFNFMCGNAHECKTAMITSFNVGSGKTFIITNLSASQALTNKKVLVIDLDIRKASASKYINSPKQGISDYLNGYIENINDIIVKDALCTNCDMIGVGTIPPNPTELLLTPKLDETFKTLREVYDYIFIDCPLIDIVADTALIGKYADITLFIARAGLLDRSYIPEIDNLYKSGRFNNMALLLNGVNYNSGYGYSKYGYHRYGYSYGYGSKNDYYHDK